MYRLTALFISIHAVFTDKVSHKNSDDFTKFAKSPYFIDKSIFIKTIFEDNTRKMILAPSGFGKTTNLKMLKSFISIPVDKKGNRINRNRTKSFRVFKKLSIYKDKAFFFDHFGKHPVIHVDLSDLEKYDFAISYKKVMRTIAKKIHIAFSEHKYLIISPHLNDVEKKLLDRWCGEDTFPKMTVWEIQTALTDLARYLFLHYECTEVFVLVDECDSIIRKAIFQANEVELGHIVQMVSEQLVTVFNPDNYVGGGLVTGVSLVAGVDLTGVSNLVVYRFLDNHPFLNFYGLTDTEADYLFENTRLNSETTSVKELRSWYNGYSDIQGTKIYNPSSLTKCHETGEIGVYRNATEISEYLGNIFTAHSIRKKILKMVGGKSVHVKFSKCGTTSNILMLRQLFLFDNPQDGVDNVFLSYLFENGYFTFDLDKKSFIKIPNKEVRQELECKLKQNDFIESRHQVQGFVK